MAVVAGLGGGLMSSAPAGPVQLQSWCWLLLVKSGEQPPDFVAGQRDQEITGWPAGAGLAGQDGQERVGEQGQDGPPVPGGPGADLVLVQAGQFLAAGESVLNQPLVMPLKPRRSLALPRYPGR